MSEEKKFPCPSCGVDSWLDVETLRVRHAPPACEAWTDAVEGLAKAQTIMQSNAVARQNVVNFDCPECKAPVRMRPLEEPIAVEHSLPSCAAWEKIEGKKDDLERYLIKAGAHIHVPVRA